MVDKSRCSEGFSKADFHGRPGQSDPLPLGNDSFFRRGHIIARDCHDRVRVEWVVEGGGDGNASPAVKRENDAAATASSASSSATGSGGAGSEAAAWIEERHVCLAESPAEAKELKRGARAVAVWIDGQAYACEVLGSAGRRQMAVQFEDGLQYDAPMESMRTLLDEPLCAPHA